MMRYRVMFCAGLAIGYVLGSRAGRERYEQIRRTAQRVADSPAIQEAAGLAGAQLSKAADLARTKVGDKLPAKLPFLHRDEDHTWPSNRPAGTHEAGASGTTGTTGTGGTGWPEEKVTGSSAPY
jgi:hypothetical protein